MSDTDTSQAAPDLRVAPREWPRRAERLLLWGLHLTVAVVAVFSAALDGFTLWIDGTRLGVWANVIGYLWMPTALAMPWLAGPRTGRRGWLSRGASPQWARRLLWPTYVLLVVLAGNTVRFGILLSRDLVDFMVPMPLAAATVLALWAWLIRRAMSDEGRAVTLDSEIGWGTRIGGVAVTVLLVCVIGGGMALCRYPRFLTVTGSGPVAVVLGGGLKKDGTATVELADRVRVAAGEYRRGAVSTVILSGAVWPSSEPGGEARNELAAMRTVALAEGIPETSLIIDPVSLNTRATAYNTVKWMEARGVKVITVCTSNYHLYRTVRSFAEYGGDQVRIVPLSLDNPDWTCADPRKILREVVGNVIYWISPRYREPMAMNLQVSKPRVVVKKRLGVLELYDGEALKKTYTCITGRGGGDKAVEGDLKTPEGTFRIVFKNPFSKFHLSLGLDYPNHEDAQRGLASGVITQKEYDDILAALASDLTKEENQKKLWYTKLGGEIFIHGNGDGRPGTAGCVAVSNKDVEELYGVLPLGTVVEIVP